MEETAMQIGEDFAWKLLEKDFHYALAVHNDRYHMHVYITFDSFSGMDGHKFDSTKGEWAKRIQLSTGRIYIKYGLPVLKLTVEKTGKDYIQWKED